MPLRSDLAPERLLTDLGDGPGYGDKRQTNRPSMTRTMTLFCSIRQRIVTVGEYERNQRK